MIWFRREWRHDLSRIRAEVLQELQTRRVIVVFDRLLRDLGYPAADDLRLDVAEGFDMLSPGRPGLEARADGRYAHPEGLERLCRENPSTSPGSQLALGTRETRLGRVTGPCAAPEHSSVAGMGTLRQPPPGDCFAALPSPFARSTSTATLSYAGVRTGAGRGTTPPWGRPTCPPTTSWGTSST